MVENSMEGVDIQEVVAILVADIQEVILEVVIQVVVILGAVIQGNLGRQLTIQLNGLSIIEVWEWTERQRWLSNNR